MTRDGASPISMPACHVYRHSTPSSFPICRPRTFSGRSIRCCWRVLPANCGHRQIRPGTMTRLGQAGLQCLDKRRPARKIMYPSRLFHRASGVRLRMSWFTVEVSGGTTRAGLLAGPRGRPHCTACFRPTNPGAPCYPTGRLALR